MSYETAVKLYNIALVVGVIAMILLLIKAEIPNNKSNDDGNNCSHCLINN